MKNRISIENLLNSFSFINSNDIVSYEFSIRKIPNDWNFTIMMGIYDIINKIIDFRIDDTFIDELYDSISYKYNFSDKFLRFLEDFQFTGDLQCIPEGEIIFPGEPIMILTGKVSEIEIIKNIIIEELSKNIGTITHCVRCLLASNEVSLISTSYDPLASKLSYIAGFKAITDLSSSIKFNIPLANNINNVSYILNSKEEICNDTRILDFNDISRTLKNIELNRSCVVKVHNKNLDINLQRIKKSGLGVKSLLVTCSDDTTKIYKVSQISHLYPTSILINPQLKNVNVESYPVYNHTQNKYLMVPTSGISTLPGVKQVYIDKRKKWHHLISIDSLIQEGLDPLIETFVKRGKPTQREIDIEAKRAVCNGSLISIPSEFLNLNSIISQPLKIHRSILDKYYKAYGDLHE
jgi:hypothetical protein